MAKTVFNKEKVDFTKQNMFFDEKIGKMLKKQLFF